MPKRITAVLVLLSTMLLLAFLPDRSAMAENEETIYIRSAEDLLTLAKKCSLDSWSNGKKVVLEQDLSLSATGFNSIPIFNGEFDGGGYTVFDIELGEAQNPCGFFIETGKDADIHDLNLQGTISTPGSDSIAGGVVGLNRGLVSNCSFTGEIRGSSKIGGIAGENEAEGVVTYCNVSGSVQGLADVGGIVGYNKGAVLHCENRMFVNTESVDPSIRLEGIDTSSVLNFIRSMRSDNAGITADIGGVVGNNEGFVEYSGNFGTVGYLHLGYNVGGIAGRSNGYISHCSNNGIIYGRENVGGIIGRAEPVTEILETENLLSGISYRLYALNRAIDDAVVDSRSAFGDLAAQFENLTNYLNPVAEAVAAFDVTNPEMIFYLNGIISDCVYNIRNEIAAMGEGIEGQAAIITEDIDVINQNLGALSGSAIQTVDMIVSENKDDILTDESAEIDGQDVTYGKTISCDNEGSINGDNNVGGIAGCLTVENDSDALLEIGSEAKISLTRNHLNVYALITGCVNRGVVTSKYDCVGGISGRMDLGAATHCAAYGSISSEEGDYAGGICGLLYGQIKNCCAKCRISAKKYVGGVVGNGYSARASDEKASCVSGCYVLSVIPDSPQYAGAVSGGAAGVYENNFFVDSGTAGLDRLSIKGRAEPISFADFSAVPNLPEECKTFTLRFVVEDAVIKEIPFEYGASFDRSVFPEVGRRDGAYAVWDQSNLNNLRFDTTVTADFHMEESLLQSSELREDGRSIIYVDGQFQHGDTMELSRISTEGDDMSDFSESWQNTVRDQLRSIFRREETDYTIPVSIAEHIYIRFTDDGQDDHNIRYLTPNGQTKNYRLYLKSADSWERVYPQVFGSYYIVNVPGTEAEMVLINTIQSWWVVGYVAAAVLILGIVILIFIKLRKYLRSRPKNESKSNHWKPFNIWLKKNRRPVLIAIPIVVILSAAVVLTLKVGNVGAVVSSCKMLKELSTKETDITTTISIELDDRKLEMETIVHRVLQDGQMYRCTQQYGIPLYIANGMVCLENGRLFQIGDGPLSQGNVVNLALKVFLNEEVRKTEEGDIDCYSSIISGDIADSILKAFVSGMEEPFLHVSEMTISLREKAGDLSSIEFAGEGVTVSGKKFRFDVILTPQDIVNRPIIPQTVVDALSNKTTEAKETLSESFLHLLAAWIRNETAETIAADIQVEADCGLLNLKPTYRYSRQRIDGVDINCISSSLFKIYFNDNGAYTASGADLTEAQKRVYTSAQLLPIARDYCMNGQFSSVTEDNCSVYTITLTSKDADEIVAQVLPEVGRININYENSSLVVTVIDDEIKTIELDCRGTLKIVSEDIDVSVYTKVTFDNSGPEIIPKMVKEKLT